MGLNMEHNDELPFEHADFVGFWKRVQAVILDVIVIIIPGGLLYWMLGALAESLQSGIPIIVEYLFFFVFNIFMIVRFGGSPGKLILKIRIVNEKGNYPTLKQALVRSSFEMLGAIFSMTNEITYI